MNKLTKLARDYFLGTDLNEERANNDNTLSEVMGFDVRKVRSDLQNMDLRQLYSYIPNLALGAAFIVSYFTKLDAALITAASGESIRLFGRVLERRNVDNLKEVRKGILTGLAERDLDYLSAK